MTSVFASRSFDVACMTAWAEPHSPTPSSQICFPINLSNAWIKSVTYGISIIESDCITGSVQQVVVHIVQLPLLVVLVSCSLHFDIHFFILILIFIPKNNTITNVLSLIFNMHIRSRARNIHNHCALRHIRRHVEWDGCGIEQSCKHPLKKLSRLSYALSEDLIKTFQFSNQSTIKPAQRKQIHSQTLLNSSMDKVPFIRLYLGKRMRLLLYDY